MYHISYSLPLGKITANNGMGQYLNCGKSMRLTKRRPMIKENEIKFTKRVGHIYELICDIDNIKVGIKAAAKGKGHRNSVKRVLGDIDYYALKIQEMLLEKTFEPSPYIMTIRHDGIQKKERLIAQPKFFPDQCVHHALMQVLSIVIKHGMYEYSCGSIPGRGTHLAKKKIEKWIRKDPKNTKYVLKLDIKKFYPSISQVVLKAYFRKKIKDPHALWLIDKIIDSYDEGLPIGNYTSQWFCNFLLQDIDHYIKEVLGIKYYVRYIDDMVLFGSNKKALRKARVALEEKLREMGLRLKENWQLFMIKHRALDFLGFRFFRDKTILRRSIALRIMRKARKISKLVVITFKHAAAMVSYMGWVVHSDSQYFYNKYIHPYVNLAQLKGVIRNESKIKCQTNLQLCH